MFLSVSDFWPLYQFAWTVYFICMFLVGFWCIFMFFGFIIPLWLTAGLKEYFGKTSSFDPEKLRRKTVAEQEGAQVIYSQPKGEGPYLHTDHH